jgi:rhamnulokinase
MVRSYIAVDLGASSGRVMVGTLDAGRLTLREINRFWNGPTEIDGSLYWDVVHLFRNIKEGIALAQQEYGDRLVSLGIDTWGVDFGLLDTNGKLLANPVHYRDSRTAGMFEKVFETVPKENVFAQSGIQFLEFNSLYQLAALASSNSGEYRVADKLLFIPDLFNYWLTGEMKAERTFASTSQFYNPVTKCWAFDLLEKLGLRTDWFVELVDPGTVIGDLDGLPVVAVGSHDTASAFAAVPVKAGERAAFLSSGTWSLLGTELREPVITEAALAANFTNEVGVGDTIRFLKNLSGFWILQELKRGWKEQGYDYSWKDMDLLADAAEPLQFFFDPADPVFAAPGDMQARIETCCRNTGQDVPTSHGAVIQSCYENLALLYADAFDTIQTLSGKELDTLRIVGGGSSCAAINQGAANALARPVIAGPREATILGNLIAQMLAMGDIQSLAEGRAIIAESFSDESRIFVPQDADVWSQALADWRSICR